MRIFLSLIFLSFSFTITNAQKLDIASFNKIIFEETFNSNSGQFKLSTTSQNYFILDDGDLFLSRNANNDYSIFCNDPIKINSYRVKTAIKLGPSNNKSAYSGILLNTQIDGNGTVSIEINSKSQYRLRQITNGKSKFISGTRDMNGWVNTDKLKNINEYNYLDIIFHEGVYDIYLNYEYLATYSVPDYQNGALGFIIAGNSKSRIDFVFVYKQGERISFEEFTSTNERMLKVEDELRIIKEENQKIISEKQNLNSEINSLNNKLSESSGMNDALNIQISSNEKEIDQLNKNITLKNNKIKDLESKNKNTANELNSIKNKLSESSGMNDALNIQISSNEKEIDQLNKNITLKNNKIKDLESKNKNTANELNSTKNKLSESSGMNDALNIQISSNEKEIDQLNKNIALKNNKIKDLESKNKNNLKKLDNTNIKIKDLNIVVSTLNSKIENKNGDITTLNSELNQLNKEKNKIQQKVNSLIDRLNLETKNHEATKKENSERLEKINIIKEDIDKLRNEFENLLDQKEILSTQLEEQKRIAAEFATALRLEIQKNKQLEKDVNFNQKDVNIIANNKKSGTIYRVQIGIFDEELKLENLENLISVPTKDGKYIYMTQKYNSYSQAKTKLIEINQLGYEDAYIVKF